MWHLTSNDAKEYAAALVAASAVGVTWWKKGFGLWTVHVKRRDATRAKVVAEAAYLARLEERVVMILATGEALATLVNEVRYQVLPNGCGVGNLRGEVTATRHDVDAVKTGLDSLRITVSAEQAARRGTNTAAVWEGRVDAEGNVICAYVSPEWTRITGLSKEDTDNQGWMRCVHPMDKDRIRAAALYASDHGTIFAEEYAIRHASNFTITPVECVSTPNCDSHGTIHTWIAIMRPIVGIPSVAG